MALIEIITGLPLEITNRLLNKEKVYYFSFIASKGGCSNIGKGDNHWLALTDRRVIYRTNLSDRDRLLGNLSVVNRDGDLPFDKISFIEVAETKESQGCSTQKGFQLRISTSGGTIIIPIPTKEKGSEIKLVYSELSHSR